MATTYPTILVRLTERDYQTLREHCLTKRLSVAQYIRNLISEDIGLVDVSLRNYDRAAARQEDPTSG